MLILKRCILSAAALTVSASSIAALPDPGLWAIDSEVNGKPGRGIQIDRQGGETIIASYYGYRADGTAVFYQAVGKITDGKTFNANLIEYKGGTVIGGSVKDAAEAKTLGPMQAVFNTDSSGSVTLPGEQSKAFSRYAYEDHRQRLNNDFLVTGITYSNVTEPVIRRYMTFRVDGKRLSISYHDHDKCEFKGELIAYGGGYTSDGAIICDTDTVISALIPRYDRFENLRVDSNGVLTGIHRTGISANDLSTETQLLGTCVNPLNVISPLSQTLEACHPWQLGLTAPPK